MTYEVALVVGLTAILTDKLHGIATGDVLGVGLQELLHAIPECGDGVNVFVQTDDKAVLLIILLHEAERIVADITVELDAGLHAPVVFVVHHQRVAEEEARLVAAHMAIAFRITVDDLLATHLLSRLSGLILVNPVRIRPMLCRNLAIVGVAGSQRRGELLEVIIKLLIIQEDPIVVEVAIEAVLDGSNGLGDLPEVGVAGKGDKGRIDSLAAVGSDILCFLRLKIVVGGLWTRE